MSSKPKKNRISFLNPVNLHKRMTEQMEKLGYNKKQKSKWICEAIEMFLDYPNVEEQVSFQGKVSSKPDEKPEHEIFYIDTELKRKIFDLQVSARLKFPELDSLQSRIVRAAIRQRIIRRR